MEKECTCEKEKCLGNMFEFVTEDGGIPGNTYIVTMGFEKKSLHVIKVRGCSALDCEVSNEESYTTLTDDELSKAKEILGKIDFSERYKHFDLKVSLASALNNIASDQKIISSKEKNEETYNKKYALNIIAPYVEENVKFNYRAGLMIQKGDEILVEANPEIDFVTIPGGRVKTMESSLAALQRELKEEMQVDILSTEVIMKALIENFFEMNGRKYHELYILYKTTIDE